MPEEQVAEQQDQDVRTDETEKDDPVLDKLLAQERELEKLRRQNKTLRAKLRKERQMDTAPKAVAETSAPEQDQNKDVIEWFFGSKS